MPSLKSFPAYEVKRCPACECRDAKHFDKRNGYELIRCARCQMVYTRNVPSTEQLCDFYNELYVRTGKPLEATVQRTFHRRWKYQLLASYLKWLHPKEQKIRLLEIASSDGDLLEAVAGDPRFIATGIDYSEDNVAYCRRQGWNALVTDLESAAFYEQTFDAIVALHVVEHLQNPIRTINEAHRVLRPGGYFFAVMPCISHLKARLAGLRWKYIAPPGHLWYFTPKSLSLLMNRLGFEVCWANCFYHRAHLRILARKPVSAAKARELKKAA